LRKSRPSKTDGVFNTAIHALGAQPAAWRGVVWRVRAVLKQFLWQAMPIFLLMCVVGAMLAYTGLLAALADILSPLMGLFGLPGR
jgi:Fe2+ transport system protein B